MKIEGVAPAYYRLPLEPMGDAAHGYAYTIGRGGRAVHALIEHDLAPLLKGRDASDIQALWDLMWQRLLYVGRGGLAAFAIAALDIALWDLRQTESFLARGLPGVKVKIGKRDAREDEARVAAVRKLIGERVDLMLDANMAWGAPEALERGRRLEQFNLYWYEEPTIPEDVAGHARLARELAVPIAVGESLHSPHDHEWRHQRFAARARDGRCRRPEGEQPLHRRAERASPLRGARAGLSGKARVRARPLPRVAAGGAQRPRAPDRGPGHRHALLRARALAPYGQ